MPAVFTDISVFPRILGNTVVQWTLNSLFNEAGPYQFSIQYSHSGTPMLDNDPASDWKTLATITDTYNYTDPNERIWSNSDHWFYRVKLVTGANNTYYSPIEPTWGKLNFHDKVIAKEIVRKERLLLDRYTGTCGLLFHRRSWGQVCPNNCIDFDTHEVVNQNCPVCFGVGYKGGYFPGMSYNINTDPPRQNKISRDQNAGMQNNIIIVGRGLACPIPKTNDFWLDSSTDQRWLIQNVATAAQLKGMPLVLQLELRLVPPTDIIQTIASDYDGMT